MDIGGVAAPKAIEAAVAAWVEAIAAEAEGAAAAGETPALVTPQAGESLLAREGFAERILGSEAPAATAEPGHEPDVRADDRAETATMQSFARPQPGVAEAAPRGDAALPSATNALSEFALPVAQLVPTTLIGLQVEAPWTRPLPQPAVSAPPQSPEEPPVPVSHDHETQPEEEEEQEAEADEPAEDTAAPDEILDAPENDHCETLARTLFAALAGAVPPPALLAAAEQWRRGRCIVLACPQGAVAAGAAWAFVLWPRRAPTAWRRIADDPSQPLSLLGRRVDARLQWTRPAPGARWWHGRMVKEHHPRRGRQLVSVDSGAPAGCEVQLGPVLTGSRRPCEVALRINGVRRFWAALGGQWSVLVVVCSLPLAGRTAASATMEDAR